MAVSSTNALPMSDLKFDMNHRSPEHLNFDHLQEDVPQTQTTAQFVFVSPHQVKQISQ